MIERKSNERLLKNGGERLGQIVGERPQARAESGAEDESLCECRHRAKNPAWPKKSFGVAPRRSGRTLAYIYYAGSSAGSSCQSLSRWRIISKRNARFTSSRTSASRPQKAFSVK